MITGEWRKPLRSGSEGNCAEIREHGGRIEIRNSKAPEAGTASFTPGEWRALVASTKDGEFDI